MSESHLHTFSRSPKLYFFWCPQSFSCGQFFEVQQGPQAAQKRVILSGSEEQVKHCDHKISFLWKELRTLLRQRCAPPDGNPISSQSPSRETLRRTLSEGEGHASSGRRMVSSSWLIRYNIPNIISYHIISYHITSHLITSYHIMFISGISYIYISYRIYINYTTYDYCIDIHIYNIYLYSIYMVHLSMNKGLYNAWCCHMYHRFFNDCHRCHI